MNGINSNYNNDYNNNSILPVNLFSHALISLLRILSRGAELFAYDWLYRHRVVDLDWDSPVTWFTAALGVDFGFYWFHRATHGLLSWVGEKTHPFQNFYGLE